MGLLSQVWVRLASKLVPSEKLTWALSLSEYVHYFFNMACIRWLEQINFSRGQGKGKEKRVFLYQNWYHTPYRIAMWFFRFKKSEIFYMKNHRIRKTWHEQSYISLILLMSSLSTRFIGLYWKWVSCNMPSFVLAENGKCNKWIVLHEYEFCIIRTSTDFSYDWL